MFQEEIKKIRQFKSDETARVGQEEEKVQVKKDEEKIEKPTAAGFKTPVQEGVGGLLKVHITFVGKLREALDIWKYRTGKSYQDIAREGLNKIFSFFQQEEAAKPFVAVQESVEQKEDKKLKDFIEKKDTLLGYLDD